MLPCREYLSEKSHHLSLASKIMRQPDLTLHCKVKIVIKVVKSAIQTFHNAYNFVPANIECSYRITKLFFIFFAHCTLHSS